MRLAKEYKAQQRQQANVWNTVGCRKASRVPWSIWAPYPAQCQELWLSGLDPHNPGKRLSSLRPIPLRDSTTKCPDYPRWNPPMHKPSINTRVWNHHVNFSLLQDPEMLEESLMEKKRERERERERERNQNKQEKKQRQSRKHKWIFKEKSPCN